MCSVTMETGVVQLRFCFNSVVWIYETCTVYTHTHAQDLRVRVSVLGRVRLLYGAE